MASSECNWNSTSQLIFLSSSRPRPSHLVSVSKIMSLKVCLRWTLKVFCSWPMSTSLSRNWFKTVCLSSDIATSLDILSWVESLLCSWNRSPIKFITAKWPWMIRNENYFHLKISLIFIVESVFIESTTFWSSSGDFSYSRFLLPYVFCNFSIALTICCASFVPESWRNKYYRTAQNINLLQNNCSNKGNKHIKIKYK